MKILKQSLCLGVLLVATLVLQGATVRPNILFIVADDMRADALAAFGNPDARTPHLDRLVGKGTFFSQAYTMGATDSQVGASTRAVMLTGRSLFRFGDDLNALEDDFPLLPELLRRRGYATFATGKWPNGKKWFMRSFSHGDEIFFGHQGNHLGLKVHDFDEYGFYPDDEAHQIESFSSHTFADATIAFLENRPRGKPFFAYVSFTAPHDPRTPPAGFTGKLPNVPKNFLPDHPFDNGALDTRDEKLLAHPLESHEVQRELASYHGMVAHMDEQIGRIIEALDVTGVKDNTVIVFTGDNGLALGSHGLLGKQNLYEQSVRVPLVLNGPGIPRDEEYIAMCYQMDLFPTICELTGTDIPKAVEGKSLVPILNSQAGQIRTSLFAAYKDQQRSIRDYRYKLIFYPPSGRYQLFNLRIDPHEMNNLYDSGKHGREINRLRIQMGAWQTSLKDPLR